MIIPSEILPGMLIEDALRQFRLNVNRPDTIFSTDHWLAPKLECLRVLLSDPITAEQAAALDDVLHGRRFMNDLIEWLESPTMTWAEFLAFCQQRERDNSWDPGPCIPLPPDPE